MPYVMLDIVLKPTPALARAVIALSQKIGGLHEAHFVLDGLDFNPHVTLYKIGVEEQNIPAVFDVVAKASVAHRAITSPITGAHSGRGYVFLRLQESEDIMQLHWHVVTEAAKLRFHGARIWGKRLNTMTPAELQLNRRFGHPNVLEEYHPHMTVIRLADPDTADYVLTEDREWETLFSSSSLAVYKMGEHGTCRELIHEAPLR